MRKRSHGVKATQRTVTVRNEIRNSWMSLRAGGSDRVVGMGEGWVGVILCSLSTQSLTH